MAKGERRGNREAKKLKKEKIKVNATPPSQKAATWQPSFSLAKRNTGCLGKPAARIGKQPIAGELDAASRCD
jgi:hypothetical protein